MSEKLKVKVNGTTANVDSTQVEKSTINNVFDLINQSHLRFGWFLGNLSVVFFSICYILKFRSDGWLKQALYRLIFTGALATFGIVLYQNKATFYTNKGFHAPTLLQDDNAHYFYNALIWLLLSQQSSLPIVSYVSFSTFHVLTFIGNDLFPALNLPASVSNIIIKFTKDHHVLSRLVAANSELLLLIVLIFRSLFFKKYSWLSLVLFSIFMKIKSEGSIFTKSILKNWEVRIDGLVSSPNVSSTLKSTWASFKRGLKNIDKVSIIKQVGEKVEK